MAFVASAVPAGNPTTSFTITIPTVSAEDVLILAAVNRDSTADPSVTDNDAGGNTWVKFGGGATGLSLWWKRATSGTSAKTITCSGLTGSSAGVLAAYSGCVTTGNPFENVSVESNASGNETHAGFTPSVDGAEVFLVVANRTNDIAITTTAATSPAILTARAAKLSTGGSDCSIAIASAEQATAGPTGNLTWAQTNAVTVSVAFNLISMLGKCCADINSEVSRCQACLSGWQTVGVHPFGANLINEVTNRGQVARDSADTATMSALMFNFGLIQAYPG